MTGLLQWNLLQFGTKRHIVRKSLGHQIPEPLRMVELSPVAELVDDDVVGEVRRQEGDAIVEVEVALGRTASPSASLVSDGDLAVRESVVLIEMDEAIVDEDAGSLAMLEIFRSVYLCRAT